MEIVLVLSCLCCIGAGVALVVLAIVFRASRWTLGKLFGLGKSYRPPSYYH